MNERDYTEQYRGIIMLRKGKEKDEDVWFATVGRQIVSDRVYKTKKEDKRAQNDFLHLVSKEKLALMCRKMGIFSDKAFNICIE